MGGLNKVQEQLLNSCTKSSSLFISEVAIVLQSTDISAAGSGIIELIYFLIAEPMLYDVSRVWSLYIFDVVTFVNDILAKILISNHNAAVRPPQLAFDRKFAPIRCLSPAALGFHQYARSYDTTLLPLRLCNFDRAESYAEKLPSS